MIELETTKKLIIIIKLHKRISLYTLGHILLSIIDRFMAHEAATLNQFSEPEPEIE